MIPMRRFIIVEEHRKLPFPEGTACAEILKAGERSGMRRYGIYGEPLAPQSIKSAQTFCFYGKKRLPGSASLFHNALFSIETSPALFGVGYIIGPKIAT